MNIMDKEYKEQYKKHQQQFNDHQRQLNDIINDMV
jgi:hypothetical protein